MKNLAILFIFALLIACAPVPEPTPTPTSTQPPTATNTSVPSPTSSPTIKPSRTITNTPEYCNEDDAFQAIAQLLASNNRFGQLIEDINDDKKDPNPILQWMIKGEIDQISDDLDDVQVPGCLQLAKDYLSDTYFHTHLYFDAYCQNDLGAANYFWSGMASFYNTFLTELQRVSDCLSLPNCQP